MNQKGFAPIIIILGIVFTVIGIGGYFLLSNKNFVKYSPTNEISPTPTVAIQSSSDVICPANAVVTFGYDTTYLTPAPQDPNQVCKFSITVDNVSDLVQEINQASKYPNLKIFNIQGPSGGEKTVFMPPEIWQLKNLQSLNIAYVEFKNSTLPAEISNVSNLKRLSVYGSNISSIPPQISQLTQLTYLDFGANNITVLPPEIGSLKNLATLNLFHNELNSLPDSIGNLQNLKKLVLSNNSFSIFPEVLTKLNGLEELNMNQNHLASVSLQIGNMNHLKKLSLNNWPNHASAACGGAVCQTDLKQDMENGNKILTFPDSIAQMSSLLELDLSNVSTPVEVINHLKQILPKTTIKFDPPGSYSNYPK
ncbi:MAG: hypothetical protein PHQ59_01350 [Candidatus Daviesbacteria bacterium]|nr:hypothetical protein [Candidatus Daviesbacteria bacterium]